MSPAKSKEVAVAPKMALAEMLAEASAIEAAILQIASENGGEVDAQMDQLLADLQKQIVTKTDSYKFVMDRLEATSEMLKQRAQEITAAARALSNAQERMKDRIKETMLAMQMTELKGDAWRYVLTPSKGRLIVEQEPFDKATADAKTILKGVLIACSAYLNDRCESNLEILQLKMREFDNLEKSMEPVSTLKMVVEPNKEEIRALIEQGMTLAFAKIEPGHVLRPYVNRG